MRFTELARFTGRGFDLTVRASVQGARGSSTATDDQSVSPGGMVTFIIHASPQVLPVFENPAGHGVQFQRWRTGGNYAVSSCEPEGKEGRFYRVECMRK